ncbi:ribonuclease H-like protein [Aspergillus sclerotioniger CBS 115572]|uniref:ribonuclease H n=1 Tax=Aspergillus sclerotioniger CBS 115572 TaxID=1450535 RepID=A0A317X3B7_9EURO|nr:ribonuclease H-like protein [Aspergillus sclerotioniger CBS 115572]PWY93124.1 ribonuclease H-like protein [Aspergillus sclerotioniger CBS 115572]
MPFSTLPEEKKPPDSSDYTNIYNQSTTDSYDTEEAHSNCGSTVFSSVADNSSTSSGPEPPQVKPTVDRRFHPERMYPSHFTPDDIQVRRGECVLLACPGSKRKCPHCNCHVCHTGCIVIAVDGACHRNGQPGARASVGVYHGFESNWNASYLLSSEENQTNQVAELVACETALIDARLMHEYGEKYGIEDRKLSIVVIKSDSEYVVRGMTEWIEKWKTNGWLNAKGQPVANREYFFRIDGIVESLEKKYVSVKFWHVPRELNKEADKLAKAALCEV